MKEIEVEIDKNHGLYPSQRWKIVSKGVSPQGGVKWLGAAEGDSFGTPGPAQGVD